MFRSLVFRFGAHIILLVVCFSQTHFTVPQGVWRISVKESSTIGYYIGKNGKRGIVGQPYQLGGYGKRYFDHDYVSSLNDLYDLDTLYINSSLTIGHVIRYFNQVDAPTFGLDSLYDYSIDFFGPDTILVSGKLTEQKKQTISFREYKIEYGATDRFTFVISIPYINRIEERRTWSWKPDRIPGMGDWIDYHQEARARLDTMRQNQSLDANMHSYLNTIYQHLYEWEGQNSVLWALESREDPLGNGFSGATFNPFTTSDTVKTTIYDLLDFYYPVQRQSSGLSDVSLGMNILLAGTPAWKGKGKFSLYGGFHIQLPSGRALRRYVPTAMDISSQPAQFRDIPIGIGVTRWKVSLFGEFYRIYRQRLFNITWYSQIGFSSREYLNTPISFLGTSITHPDSIASMIGLQHFFRQGGEFQGDVAAKLELWPNRITVGTSLALVFKGRDEFSSPNSKWDQWMVSHSGFDTRVIRITHALVLFLQNVDPLRKIGPIPFEFEMGVTSPLYSRNTYSNWQGWVKINFYLQAW